MNANAYSARLLTLSREIHRLQAMVVEAERAETAMVGDELECARSVERTATAKAALDKALNEHFMLAHWVLFSKHGARAA